MAARNFFVGILLVLALSDCTLHDSTSEIPTFTVPDTGISKQSPSSIITISGTKQWTLMKGTQDIDPLGVYGTMGVADTANRPGGRYNYGMVMDSANNIWIFGGTGFDATSGPNYNLSDLWKFDGTNWTWMAGTTSLNSPGIYDSKGTPSPTARPGGRRGVAMWCDANNHIWIFGGYGRNAAGAEVWLQDMWKFDGNQWTWVWGDNTGGNINPVGGAVGVYDASYSPAGRIPNAHWKDSSGGFYIMGGKWGPNQYTMDVWRWNGSQWAFMGGNATPNGPDSYGPTRTASALSYPGGNVYSDFWADTSGNVWLYGVSNRQALWKWDGSNFAFWGGSQQVNATSTFGTKGVADPGNWPRTTNSYPGTTWVNPTDGHLWMYGGWGKDASGTAGNLDSLWEFDGSNWTWISGTNSISAPGTANYPGARSLARAVVDSHGDVWLFGGWGTDSATGGYMSDLWKLDF